MIESGLYKHYKGNIYEIIGVAKHSETLEELIVYKATYQKEGENLWVRPAALFFKSVVVNGQMMPRFVKL